MAKKAYIGVPKTSNSITSLLLHGENIADSSGNNCTITNNGVTVSAGKSKFGGKSLYFNGSSYMKIALPISGDCTVDFWFYQESHISSYPTPMNFTSGASRGLYVHTRSSKTCYAASTPSASENEIEVAVIALNTWHHMAFVRSGTTTKFYLDGVVQGTLTGTVTTNDILYLGYLQDYPDITWFNGWIDELRVSSIARWTADFTPPTSAYSVDSEITTTSSVAREIKKGYVGVDGVARKIKKAYIGIGGVARPFWGGGELAYYGTATALSAARFQFAAATVGNYALFGGGRDSSTNELNTVDAYSASLTRSTPTALSTYRYGIAATSVGNYALFGGGNTSRSSGLAVVDAYSASLTRSTPTGLSTGRYYLAATSVGNYALFGGGVGSSNYSTVDAYNTSLTRSTPTALSAARYNLAATTVGNYALFGGGYVTSTPYSTVDAYNASLTRSTPAALSVARHNLAAATVGNYALFGGGYYSSPYSTVDAYNTSLTRSTPTALSAARGILAATAVGDYALFGGGWYVSTKTPVSTVDAYNTSLTRSTPTALSAARYDLAATTVGNYALFGGGHNSESINDNVNYSTVDAYVVA